MKVWVARRVIKQIELSGRAFAPLETGGVLLGWRDGEDRIIADLIGPGPHALHGRHMFLPDHLWQVQQIRAAFKASRGDLDYLGDWHTHPADAAEMSLRDRKTLARLDRRVRGALMMIASGDSPEWSFGVWSRTRQGPFRSGPVESRDLVAFDPPSSWPSLVGAA